MKYLILILIIVAVLWLMRASRRRVPPPAPGPAADKSTQHEPMLACAHCGLHLPRGEALPGRGGVFCGEAHRAEYERAHPEA